MKLFIPDMTCGHCKATVERTIAALDGAATVLVDLPTHTVDVTSTLPMDVITKALEDEGYPATQAA